MVCLADICMAFDPILGWSWLKRRPLVAGSREWIKNDISRPDSLVRNPYFPHPDLHIALKHIISLTTQIKNHSKLHVTGEYPPLAREIRSKTRFQGQSLWSETHISPILTYILASNIYLPLPLKSKISPLCWHKLVSRHCLNPQTTLHNTTKLCFHVWSLP